MNFTSSSPRGKTSPKKSVVVIETPRDAAAVPYDENLLERARTQWQFGDWQSLQRLDRDTLQHHPDRAKLVLLAAAGQLQAEGAELARTFVQLAHDWGCSNKLVIQILAAGVHNSLGRAAALAGNYPRALKHFEDAIQLGSAGSDTRLIVRARAGEQLSQLGLRPPENFGEITDRQARRDSPVVFNIAQASRRTSISRDTFFSEREGDRARSLEEVRRSADSIFSAEDLPDVTWVSVEHRGKAFFFIHFSGDYIPGKMAEKNLFYESPYLNLLARLHQPGKLIIDGGANIGNHSVFFAGVMGAEVIAFEPQPFNYQFLVANVHLNRLDEKVDIRKTALGDQTGRISLVQALPGNYGSFTSDQTLVKHDAGEAHPVTPFDVEVSTLDAELDEYRSAISIIKLDLEGMEFEALRGATGVIRESAPVIAVECFTRSMYQKIKEFLAAFGYFVIDSTNATPTFIFLSRKNPHHLEMLSRYLEMSSLGKFASNSSFNESAS